MAIQNTLEGASPESRGVYRLKSIILVHLYNLLSLLLILPYIRPFATHLVAVVQFSSVHRLLSDNFASLSRDMR